MRDLNQREAAWVRRLQRTLDSIPPSLALLCTGDDIAVLDERAGDEAHDEATRRDHVLCTVDGKRLEAGDW